jgi:hypothetical protein
MKLEHETYELIYSDILNKLEKENLLKKIKSEVTDIIGYGDIINEEKTEKIECIYLFIVAIMIKYAHEMAQVVSD